MLPEQLPLVEHPWSRSRETLPPIAIQDQLVVPPLILPVLPNVLTCLEDLLSSFQASMELGHIGLRKPKYLAHELFLVCVLLGQRCHRFSTLTRNISLKRTHVA